jgi:hypothetical protein
MDDRLDRALSVAYNVAYVAAVACMVLALFPAVRQRLGVLAEQQAYAWRQGRWLAGRMRTPSWTQLLARDDLPSELQP